MTVKLRRRQSLFLCAAWSTSAILYAGAPTVQQQAATVLTRTARVDVAFVGDGCAGDQCECLTLTFSIC